MVLESGFKKKSFGFDGNSGLFGNRVKSPLLLMPAGEAPSASTPSKLQLYIIFVQVRIGRFWNFVALLAPRISSSLPRWLAE